MTELARGRVSDRPWGLTLGALGMRGLTGVLRLTSESKLFSLRFENGTVIDATSTLLSDSAARVAMTSQLINPQQFGESIRLLALMPDRDELAVVAEVAALTAAQLDKLRRHVIAQRTARTLSITEGEFVITSAPPGDAPCALDIRPLIYLGALVHMPQPHLESELAGLGTRFQLKPFAEAELPAYGFTGAERAVVSELAHATSIEELERACPDLDRRTICAVVYTLVSGLACATVEVPPPPVVARTNTQKVASKIDPNTSFNVPVKDPVKDPPKPPAPRPPTAIPDEEATGDLELDDVAFIEDVSRRRTAAMWAQGPFDAEHLEALARTESDVPPAPPAHSRTEQLLVFAAISREPASRTIPVPQVDDPFADVPLLDDDLLEPLPDEEPSIARRRWLRAGTESAWLPLELRRPAARDDE